MIKTTLTIDGMMCGMCENHVNEAIRNNLKITSVKSSHSKGITEIISDSELDEEKIKSIIKETGYELKGIETTEAEKRKLPWSK